MATTDLVTYYGQTNRIDQFVDKYGPCLEKLNREVKLMLRITLSAYIFRKQQVCNPYEYTVTEVMDDALCDLLIVDSIPDDLSDVCTQLEGLRIDEAEALLEALQHQLRWGNARMVTI